MKVIRYIKRLIPDFYRGYAQFYLFPKKRRAWGGPFNGQTGRCSIYRQILSVVQPALIVETGTHYGTTTELLAESGLQVVTIESNARNYGFASARLRRTPNVELRLGDSRVQLPPALEAHKDSVGDRPVFAYLDAHWGTEPPLAAEIEILFSRHPNAVVMIDDFQVPDDPGYQYDNYGPGKAFTPDYVAPAMRRHKLAAFYPALPSDEETGARRGCVVLARTAIWFDHLDAIKLLRSS